MEKRGITRRALAFLLMFLILILAINIYTQDKEKDIKFFLAPQNQPPEFLEVAEEIFVCEGTMASYEFNAIDPEDDFLRFDMQPKKPFYLRELGKNETVHRLEIFSSNLTKLEAKLLFYDATVSATDEQYIDSKEIGFTTIEINNAPVVEDIGAQTIEIGDTFEKIVSASDKESDELRYELTFLTGIPLFDINQEGIINYTVESEDLGTYSIRLCVTDKALKKPHRHIGLCGQDGSAITTCDNFEFTVVAENNQPTILSFYPEDESIISRGDLENFFNLSKFDPDGNTPDTLWYVDDKIIEVDTFLPNDEFTYVFGCNISGNHIVKAEVTDGDLSDTISWNLTVNPTHCPQGIIEGTNLKEFVCEEKWGCTDWSICQLAKQSRDIGILAYEDYDKIAARCQEQGWDSGSCGFQTRDCIDANACKTMRNPSSNIQSCEFTREPSCFDDVSNCHNSSCEILSDCGGPCDACATCSDGIQNQEEQGLDCGGPCPDLCPVPEPLISDPTTKNLILIIFVIATIILIWQAYRIFRMKNQIETPTKHEKALHPERYITPEKNEIKDKKAFPIKKEAKPEYKDSKEKSKDEKPEDKSKDTKQKEEEKSEKNESQT